MNIGFCSQNHFAKLIGRSFPFVQHLRFIGVVKYCGAGVLIARSLRNYFTSYLPPNIRRAEIKKAVGRIISFDCAPDSDFLNSARAIQRKIDAAQEKVFLLKIFNQLDEGAATMKMLESTTRQLQALTVELSATKNKLQRAICALSLPPAFETVLLRRYVFCENWKEIAESTFALSSNFKFHRQARKIFNALAQDCEQRKNLPVISAGFLFCKNGTRYNEMVQRKK